MGLFSFVGKTIGSVLGGITGTNAQAKGAAKAADAQVQAAQLGIDESKRQFDLSRADQLPFLQTGQEALSGQADLLGLNGMEKQASSIAALRDSPLFEALFRTGQDTILNNASATGGLRGGNLQSGLANFGSDTLAKVIQSQLQDLGGISSQGGVTAGNLGALGANNSNTIANLLGQQGAARAGNFLAQGNKQASGIQSGLNLASSIAGFF